MPLYPNGTGQSLGDTLATCEPIYTSGDIWYVDSATGSDSYSGLDDKKPLATLDAAVAAASANDIIVLMDGHSETLESTTISTAGIVIVGGGSSSGLPTVKLTPPGGGTGLTISGTGVQLRNLWFEDRTAANESGYAGLSVTGANFQMIGCYCEVGQFDTGSMLSLGSGANNARLVNTTFIATGASLTAQPSAAVKIAAAVSDLDLDGLVLSGGTYGFSSPYAFDNTTASVAITRLKGTSVSLLLGADMSLYSTTTGFVNVQTTTGGSRVVWGV